MSRGGRPAHQMSRVARVSNLIVLASVNLPNGVRALVDIRKLREYCLSLDHPRGRHKARIFAAALGLGPDDADFLRGELERAAVTGEVVVGEADEYGQRYVVDFEVVTGSGPAVSRSTRIVRTDEDFPRLTSCYVL